MLAIVLSTKHGTRDVKRVEVFDPLMCCPRECGRVSGPWSAAAHVGGSARRAAIIGHNGLRTIWRYVHPTSAAQKQAMENYEAAQKRRKLKLVNGK
jgi:hypothetical protein